jgi:hypothetical protein
VITDRQAAQRVGVSLQAFRARVKRGAAPRPANLAPGSLAANISGRQWTYLAWDPADIPLATTPRWVFADNPRGPAPPATRASVNRELARIAGSQRKLEKHVAAWNAAATASWAAQGVVVEFDATWEI